MYLVSLIALYQLRLKYCIRNKAVKAVCSFRCLCSRAYFDIFTQAKLTFLGFLFHDLPTISFVAKLGKAVKLFIFSWFLKRDDLL